MRTSRSGFTIVELLIVIVVIAILAAISIVAYNGIQQRARNAAQQATLTQLERTIMADILQQYSESISLSATLIASQEGQGTTDLLRTLSGTPNITIYVVHSVTSTTSNYHSFANLQPYVSGSQVISMYNTAPGSDALGYRIDTSAQTNNTATVSGYRVPGNTIIGWLQVSNNATTRSFGYNQAASHASYSLSPHSGWNFTGFTLNNADGTARAGLVFNAAHDQATRLQMMRWLNTRYSAGLSL